MTSIGDPFFQTPLSGVYEGIETDPDDTDVYEDVAHLEFRGNIPSIDKVRVKQLQTLDVDTGSARGILFVVVVVEVVVDMMEG
jgi:hypothetical protein